MRPLGHSPGAGAAGAGPGRSCALVSHLGEGAAGTPRGMLGVQGSLDWC